MKKILIALIVWGAITFINIDLFANTYDDPVSGQYINVDTPISLLAGNSLKQVFEDYNEVLNYNLSDSSNYISVNNTYFNVSNGVGTFLPSSQYGRIQQNIMTYQNDFYFGSISVKTDKNTVGIDPQSSLYRVLHTGSGNWERLSFYFQAPTTDNYGVRIIDIGTSNFTEIKFKFLYYINATYHQIDHLSESQINYFYNLYSILTLGISPTVYYDQGYDIGYDNGYDDGYINGEIFGYNDGYNDGLTEGYFNGQVDYYNGTYLPQLPGETSTPYNDGQVDGYQYGYATGFDDGIVSDVDTSWLLDFVSGTVNVLGVTIVPGISLGVFVFIPLFLGFIGFIFRLGGRRG